MPSNAGAKVGGLTGLLLRQLHIDFSFVLRPLVFCVKNFTRIKTRGSGSYNSGQSAPIVCSFVV